MMKIANLKFDLFSRPVYFATSSFSDFDLLPKLNNFLMIDT